MKVIFLDIDGVLNHVGIKNMLNVDPACVQRVNTIGQRTGAVICLSSTRRNWSDTKPILLRAGLKVPIVGITPDIGFDKSRGDEIRAWISKNQVESFVIIDDDTDFDEELTQNLVKTSSTEGLQDPHVEAAVMILGHK